MGEEQPLCSEPRAAGHPGGARPPRRRSGPRAQRVTAGLCLFFVLAASGVGREAHAWTQVTEGPRPRPVAEPTAAGCRAGDQYGDETRWNDPRSLSFVEAAREARRHAWADTALHAFQAYAEGIVDFLASYGGGTGERLLRADKIALELQWQRDGGSLQTLVGRRHAEWFPSRIRYHVDHLSLFLDNFGDRIAIGEGEEVRDVPHPLAVRQLGFYDYRLVDSLGLRINERWTRVYRVQVRPTCPGSAGVVGTLDVDRETLAIARLSATFTPASYVDPTVTHVSVELENALVEGRFWLPAAQRVEVRRQYRWLDLPFGGTIRTSFRILERTVNPSDGRLVGSGDRIAALPEGELRRYAGWRSAELRPVDGRSQSDSILFDESRRRAVTIAAGRYLGGGARLRLSIPSFSSAFRLRRAEGAAVGAGARFDVDGARSVVGSAGYAFGRARPQWSLRFEQSAGGSIFAVEGYLERQADIGPFAASSGTISTLGAAFRGDDFLDPYWTDGLAIGLSSPIWGGRGHLRLTWEEHSPAALELDALGDVTVRPVRAVVEGTDVQLEGGFERAAGSAAGAVWTVHLRTQLADGGDFGYTRWIATVTALPAAPLEEWQWEGAAALAVASGDLPEQRLYLLGGRGTVAGYEFRGWAGDRVFYASAALSRAAFVPWLRFRALGAVGAADLTGVGREAAARMGVRDSGGLRTSLGGGVSVLWDVVRLDVVRGLDSGHWEWMLSVNPALRAPL